MHQKQNDSLSSRFSSKDTIAHLVDGTTLPICKASKHAAQHLPLALLMVAHKPIRVDAFQKFSLTATTTTESRNKQQQQQQQ